MPFVFSPPELRNAKKRLRLEMKKRLGLLRPEDSLFLRERLQGNLWGFLSSRPGLWASYRPFGFEASPPREAPPGVEWVYPRLEGESLVFHRGDVFEKGRHGLEQPPASSERIEVSRLTGVLVPGLAFDREGRRLGRGAGFYDRTLAAFPGCKVGVAHACQIVPALPDEDWDVTMNAVVTDQTVIVCGGI
ncbi:MAG: 5-formyltetrahydrofolate cyclo-ligase [Bdellovibrionaceae bacterium]|nr:5-formyltetrahydrofolate cyclo-ligase [Pseudobdellovibrionaceae bacterium]MBX3034212.1 5-formyltetrahydrofolate cyclo-ligase [Pseudobdellovibrionaceae bacterium]